MKRVKEANNKATKVDDLFHVHHRMDSIGRKQIGCMDVSTTCRKGATGMSVARTGSQCLSGRVSGLMIHCIMHVQTEFHPKLKDIGGSLKHDGLQSLRCWNVE